MTDGLLALLIPPVLFQVGNDIKTFVHSSRAIYQKRDHASAAKALHLFPSGRSRRCLDDDIVCILYKAHFISGTKHSLAERAAVLYIKFNHFHPSGSDPDPFLQQVEVCREQGDAEEDEHTDPGKYIDIGYPQKAITKPVNHIDDRIRFGDRLPEIRQQ